MKIDSPRKGVTPILEGSRRSDRLPTETQTSTLSPKDKLIVRLEHTLEHNREHAEAYRRMAGEARQLGQEEAARLIHSVAEQTGHQGEDLKKALEGEDIEEVKTKTEALQEAVYEVSALLYQKAQEEADHLFQKVFEYIEPKS